MINFRQTNKFYTKFGIQFHQATILMKNLKLNFVFNNTHDFENRYTPKQIYAIG